MNNRKSNGQSNKIEIQDVPTFYRFPFIKVNVFDDVEQIDFRLSGHFTVEDLNGKCVFDSLTGEARWRVAVEASAPTKFGYGISVHEYYDKKSAETLARKLQKKGFHPKIQTFGYQWLFGDNRKIRNSTYRVYLDGFSAIREARKVQRQLFDFQQSTIFKYRAREARGVMEMFDVNYSKSTKCGGPIKLTPRERSSTISLLNVRNKKDSMEFPNLYDIQFRINDKGKLQCVAEMDIEAYVGGLLTAQYQENYPDSYMETLSITLRSWVAANWGRLHKGEAYQFCSTDHCFYLSGLQPWPRRVMDVMKKTKGLVLTCGEEICNTPSHLVCGGHTESLENVGDFEPKPYLVSLFDTNGHEPPDEMPENLNNEEAIEIWINSQPAVHCNFSEMKDVEDFQNFRQYFRWETEYTRQELEEIISQKTEEDIGTLYDIVPLKRGESGRLVEVEILGSRQNVKLVGDLTIRQAFSQTQLPSSCFIVRAEMDEHGIPTIFNFIGAGSGDGVGMCQLGAIAKAHSGQTPEEIIRHYFGEGIQLEKLPLT
ncbi:MAG: SpoIID/LytB domain-containing protein [Calditrichaeota bacterium]|nr:SpoIID/LytB domain-containing protein [Calditrichota bacterium]